MASDSSDDDMPLARSNGHMSAPTIPKEADAALDRNDPKRSAPRAGVSIRHGPVVEVGGSTPNGIPKRKERHSLKAATRDESDSDSAPLAKRPKQSKQRDTSDSDDEPIIKKKLKLPPSINETEPRKSGDKETPATKLARQKTEIEKEAAKQAKSLQKGKMPARRDDDSDTPLSEMKGTKRKSNGISSSSKKTNGVKEADSDFDEPSPKKPKKSTPAPKPSKPIKNGVVKKETTSTPTKKPGKGKASAKPSEEPEGSEEEGEEEFAWWDAPKKEDDTVKWNTLEHNGVIFPPAYIPLPKNVRLHYDGKPVELHLDAEEVAFFFGSMLHSTHNVDNPVFQKNFFNDFKEIIKKSGGAKDKQGNKVEIKEFDKLDFKPIHQHWHTQNEAKKGRSAAEKKAEKVERDEIEAPYRFCKWDNRKEKVANCKVEPPGLFRGRGSHPKTGRVKLRVMPEQVTINIGKDAKVPDPPAGHKWKAVQHDNKCTWLAMWQENINNQYKYVMLAADSAIKGQADFKKFEKARALKKFIGKVRKDYEHELKSGVMADRQRATAMYLIDRFALRAGNEKDTDNEADTVGCCSLKFEHITLREPDIVIFDFLGKDSIRYYDEAQVDRQVFKNLKLFKKGPKTDGDDIFDRLTTASLNKHLSTYMKGLTAKVFRTYNASFTMSELLRKLDITKAKTVAEQIKLYNDCNRKVAELCNHKRTVGAGHEAQMEKIDERIKGLKYQKWRVKMMMLDVDPKQKKKKGADYFEREPELDDTWVQEHQTFLVEEQRTKITKKFEKDNEKLKAGGEKPMPEKELKDRLQVANELEAKFKKENKSKKVEAEGKGPTVEKLEVKKKTLEERIAGLEAQAADREDNKEVALGTSKINYIDPRLTVAFCNKFNLPIEKFFSKTLREKFNWAIKSVGSDDSWQF